MNSMALGRTGRQAITAWHEIKRCQLHAPGTLPTHRGFMGGGSTLPEVPGASRATRSMMRRMTVMRNSLRSRGRRSLRPGSHAFSTCLQPPGGQPVFTHCSQVGSTTETTQHRH